MTLHASIDATIASANGPVIVTRDTRDCCLVQIYPTNIVDGLMRLGDDTLTIGRDNSNDLTLDDGSVSRHHASLTRCDDGYLLKDLGSTNGTIVDNQTVTERVLAGGETIRFGSFIFKFLRANGIEAQYHETVYAAMTRDGLTGAFNKSYLLDSLAQEISRSRRCNRSLCVLIMDIDFFKKVNDTYGHLVGDEVLREFSQRIADTKRDDDLLCRYGGEEFVLILSETDLEHAIGVATRCIRAVGERPFTTSAGDIPVTVSIGVGQLPKHTNVIDSIALLEMADVQLYRAKESGRNRVCFEGIEHTSA
jgi:diguanylate cyclase (GGDEF)-like protein